MSTAKPAPPDNEIVSSRVFEEPRELVFRAWTEPKHLAAWWGPNGFTNTFHEFDPRPDGHWRFIMHGPDGRHYENHSIFREIEPPTRIVFDHVTDPRFQVVATFEAPEADRTLLTFRMIFETVEICTAVKRYAVDCNEQNFDRLAAEMIRMSERPDANSA